MAKSTRFKAGSDRAARHGSSGGAKSSRKGVKNGQTAAGQGGTKKQPTPKQK